MARKKTQQKIVAAIEGAREGAAGEIGRIVADMTGKKTKGRSGMGGGYTQPIPGEKLPPEPPPFKRRKRPPRAFPPRPWPRSVQPAAPPTGIDPQGAPEYRPYQPGYHPMPGDPSSDVRAPAWESPNVRGFGRSRAITPGYEDNQTQRYAHPMPGDPSSDARHRRSGLQGLRDAWPGGLGLERGRDADWPFSGGGGGRGNAGDHYSSFGPKPVPSFFPGVGGHGGEAEDIFRQRQEQMGTSAADIQWIIDHPADFPDAVSGAAAKEKDRPGGAFYSSATVDSPDQAPVTEAASTPDDTPPPADEEADEDASASLPDFVSTDTGIQLDAMPVSAAGTDVPDDAYSLVRGERDPGSGQEYEAWQNPTGDWFRRWMGQDAPPPPAAAVDPNVPAEGEYDFDVTGAGYTDAELLAAQAGKHLSGESRSSTGASETNYRVVKSDGTFGVNAGWLRARQREAAELGIDTSGWNWVDMHPQSIQDMINNRRGHLPGGAYGTQTPVDLQGPAPAPPSPPRPVAVGSPPPDGNEQSLLAIRTMLEQLMANQQPEPTQPWNPATGPAQGYDPGFAQSGLPKNYATMWNTPMAGSTMAPGSPWRTDTSLQVLPQVQSEKAGSYYAHPRAVSPGQWTSPVVGGHPQMTPGRLTQYLDQFRPSDTYEPTLGSYYSQFANPDSQAAGGAGGHMQGTGGYMQGAGGYMQGAGESRFAPPGYMGGGMGGDGEENGYGGGKGQGPFDAQGGIDAFVTALGEIISNIGDEEVQRAAWAMLAQSASGDFASLITGMYGLTGQLYAVDRQAALAMEGLTQQAGQFAAGLGLDIFGQQQAGAISGYQSETARMGVAGQLQAIAAELGMGATIEAAIADQDYDIAARQIQAAIEQIYSQERLGLTQIDSSTRIAMTNAYNTASQIESSERVSMANVGMQGTLGLEGIAQSERGNRTGFIGQAMNSPGAMIPVLNALRNPETMGDFDPWAMARTTPWGNMYQGIPGMVQAGEQAGVGQPSPAAMNMQSNMGQPSPDPDFAQAFSQARNRELAQGQPSQVEPAGTAMNMQSFYDPNNMFRQLGQPSQVEPPRTAPVQPAAPPTGIDPQGDPNYRPYQTNMQSNMQNIQSDASAASLPSFNSMSLAATPAGFAASVPGQSQLSQTGTGTNFPTTQEPVNVMPNIAAPDWMNMLEPERNIYARALGSFYPDFEEEQNAIVGTGVGPDRAIFAGV